MTLNDKQQAFVEAYLENGFNATRAAKAAGYSHANKQGPRLLVNVGIRAAIDARLGQLAMGADEVLARLASQASASIEDFLDGKNKLDLKTARANGQLHLVHKLKQTEHTDALGGVTRKLELELYDAQAALVALGRHHVLFTDRFEVHDWRQRAKAAGVDPDDLVEIFKQMMLAGKGAPHAGNAA